MLEEVSCKNKRKREQILCTEGEDNDNVVVKALQIIQKEEERSEENTESERLQLTIREEIVKLLRKRGPNKSI